MSVEKLLSAMKKEAELREKAILEKADGEARGILSSAREQLEALEAMISKEEKESALRRESLRLAGGRMLERKRAILAQYQAQSVLFKECASMFRRFMDSPAYAEFIEREYGKVNEELGAVDEVRADPQTAAILKKLNVPSVVLDEGVHDGFIAFSTTGRKKISCLFSLRLEKKWRDAAPGFVARLGEALR
jgi:cell division septum initiation protein DivIVA